MKPHKYTPKSGNRHDLEDGCRPTSKAGRRAHREVMKSANLRLERILDKIDFQ